MKRRLSVYEKLGVQATLEVQKAARLVARENSLLRELLTRKGVSLQDVDEYLRSSIDSHYNEPLHFTKTSLQKDVSIKTPVNIQSRSDRLQTVTVQAVVSSADQLPNSLSKRPSASKTGSLNHSNRDTNAYLLSSHETACQPQVSDNRRDKPVIHNTVTGLADSLVIDKIQDTGFDKPCEEAAIIIATMLGHRDRERARFELGCDSQTNCRVKNVRLLEIMDTG
jgi:hypothetical protein